MKDFRKYSTVSFQWLLRSDLDVQRCHFETNAIRDIQRTEPDWGTRLIKDIANTALVSQEHLLWKKTTFWGQQEDRVNTQTHTYTHHTDIRLLSKSHSHRSHHNCCVSYSCTKTNLYPLGSHFANEIWKPPYPLSLVFYCRRGTVNPEGWAGPVLFVSVLLSSLPPVSPPRTRSRTHKKKIPLKYGAEH